MLFHFRFFLAIHRSLQSVSGIRGEKTQAGFDSPRFHLPLPPGKESKAFYLKKTNYITKKGMSILGHPRVFVKWEKHPVPATASYEEAI